MTYAALTMLPRYPSSAGGGGANEDLSLALLYQLKLPIEFARFAQMCITLDNQARMRKNTPSRLVPLSLPLTQNAEPAPNPISAPSSGGGDPMDLSKASSACGPLTAEEKKHRLSIISITTAVV